MATTVGSAKLTLDEFRCRYAEEKPYYGILVWRGSPKIGANHSPSFTATIFVLDPDSKVAWKWNEETSNLDRVSVLILPNKAFVSASEVWKELDQLTH